MHIVNVKREGHLHRLVANMLDCNIVLNKFKVQSGYYIYFWTNTLWKDMNPFIPQPWIKLFHFCFSTKMNLALNNP